MNPNPCRRPRPGPQRGAAALIVVMLLFFLVSLVAAYAARNLLFEQKTSANQYRATQAFEAAEAGLEWALAMLNGSRIDAACNPLVPPDVSQDSFRQRYLNIDLDGGYAPRLLADGTSERPSCVQSATGWSCSCPSGGAPSPSVPADGAVHPAFRVCFEKIGPPTGAPLQPGTVRVVSTGRTAFVDEPCNAPVEGTDGEAAASVSVVVALSSALPVPPAAAATAGRDLTMPAGMTTATLINTDALTNGLTAHIGRTRDLSGATLVTLPGTPSQSSSVVDTKLGTLASTAPVPLELFRAQFRMPAPTYKGQPATVFVDCSSDCANRVNEAVQGNPGRIVWVGGSGGSSGNASLSGASLNLGSDDEPAMLVVDGDIDFNGSTVNIVGMVYSQQDILFNGATVNVRGAVMAARDIVANGSTVTVDYNPAHPTQPTLIPPVLTHLRLASGSLVRVPGSWRDFP